MHGALCVGVSSRCTMHCVLVCPACAWCAVCWCVQPVHSALCVARCAVCWCVQPVHGAPCVGVGLRDDSLMLPRSLHSKRILGELAAQLDKRILTYIFQPRSASAGKCSSSFSQLLPVISVFASQTRLSSKTYPVNRIGLIPTIPPCLGFAFLHMACTWLILLVSRVSCIALSLCVIMCEASLMITQQSMLSVRC